MVRLSTECRNKCHVSLIKSLAVAGSAPLVSSYDSTCTAHQIRRILLATSRYLGRAGCDVYFGHGMVQAKAAVDMLLAGGCNAADELPLLDADGMNYDGSFCSPIPYENTCDDGIDTMTLDLLTDQYPEETSWVVVGSKGIQAAIGDGYKDKSTLFNEAVTVCKGEIYDFTILDSYEDGICCDYGSGSYTVKRGDEMVKENGGVFLGSETSSFFSANACTNACTTPQPTPNPTETTTTPATPPPPETSTTSTTTTTSTIGSTTTTTTQTAESTVDPTTTSTSTTTSPLRAQPSIFINAGGQNYTDSDGNTWLSDEGYYTSGIKYSTTASIDNTDKPDIYQTERYKSDMRYIVGLLNGVYDVSLHSAEIDNGAFRDDACVFDVLIEGTLVLDDFDIYKEAGKGNRAHVMTIPGITVNDDVLTIDFIKVKQNPKVNGIEIHPASSQFRDSRPLPCGPAGSASHLYKCWWSKLYGPGRQCLGV